MLKYLRIYYLFEKIIRGIFLYILFKSYLDDDYNNEAKLYLDTNKDK